MACCKKSWKNTRFLLSCHFFWEVVKFVPPKLKLGQISWQMEANITACASEQYMSYRWLDLKYGACLFLREFVRPPDGPRLPMVQKGGLTRGPLLTLALLDVLVGTCATHLSTSDLPTYTTLKSQYIFTIGGPKKILIQLSLNRSNHSSRYLITH